MKKDINDIKQDIRELLSGNLSPKQREEYLKMEAVRHQMQHQWSNPGEEPADSEVKDKMWNKISTACFGAPRHFFLHKAWIGAAASIVIILTLAGLWLVPMLTQEKFIEIVAQHSRLYVLPDSSRVWMQPGSHLRYSNKFSENRQVWLKGNSLFEVQHKQDGATFKVYIDKAYIEVKGTCFLVKQNSNRKSEVTLFNGKIDFNIVDKKQCIQMKPSDKVIFDTQSQKAELLTSQGIDWDNGCYKFTDMPLSKFIKFINQMNDTTIVLDEAVDRSALFSGQISYNESAENIADNICFSMDLMKIEKNNKIILRAK